MRSGSDVSGAWWEGRYGACCRVAIFYVGFFDVAEGAGARGETVVRWTWAEFLFPLVGVSPPPSEDPSEAAHFDVYAVVCVRPVCGEYGEPQVISKTRRQGPPG